MSLKVREYAFARSKSRSTTNQERKWQLPARQELFEAQHPNGRLGRRAVGGRSRCTTARFIYLPLEPRSTQRRDWVGSTNSLDVEAAVQGPFWLYDSLLALAPVAGHKPKVGSGRREVFQSSIFFVKKWLDFLSQGRRRIFQGI